MRATDDIAGASCRSVAHPARRGVRRRSRRRGRVAVVLLLFGVTWVAPFAPPARATVFLAKDEALALAFPGNDRVEERTFILTDAQKADVEHRARAPLDSQLFTLYVGWKGGEVQGYGVVDTHVVRTLPETILVVLDPKGTVRRVHILAFNEPPEYMPTERWLDKLGGRALDDELKVGAGIQGITGATLSAQAMTDGVRRALALFAVLVKDAAPAGGK
jgi:hypothetical protein